MNTCYLILLLLSIFNVAAASELDVASLKWDENLRLKSNYLVYSEQCSDQLNNFIFDHRPHIMATDIERFYENVTPEGCAAVCLQKGMHVDHIFKPLPTLTTSNNNGLVEWTNENCQSLEVGFVSMYSYPLKVYWRENINIRHYLSDLKSGEQKMLWQMTHLGHVFEIDDPTTNQMVFNITVTHHAFYRVGDDVSLIRDIPNVEKEIENTLGREWGRANAVQRTFTEFGFNKGKLPLDLWGSMSAYYYNNRAHKMNEEWSTGAKGYYVNWWEQNVYLIGMPWTLKRYWQSRLRELVEKWSGVELELTDIYGMRRYEDGARLLTHVDRESTHAASLIINVAQGGIRSPWKVEIYDFAFRLHEIEMEEGDIVYYESARCLHGRMAPLDGAYYVNLFAHYRPVGDPDWFKKSNPPETTSQAIDLGDCQADGKKVSCSGGLSTPYLSPSMKTLAGPADLFKYWKEVSPK